MIMSLDLSFWSLYFLFCALSNYNVFSPDSKTTSCGYFILILHRSNNKLNLVVTISGCVCRKVKEMGPFSALSE